jgi:ABC-type lipoprotein release transport system permease subunit
MVIIKLAFRTIARRKARMILIGTLVAFGTFLIVFGTEFTESVRVSSRLSLIDNFTGDFVVYSDKAKEVPSPFAFQTPSPLIRDSELVRKFIQDLPGVENVVPYAQNYAIIQVDRNGEKIEVPFIFYAIDPPVYRKSFDNASISRGSFFGVDGKGGPSVPGVLISGFQNTQYEKNYGVRLAAGDRITVLGLTGSGVNAVSARVVGIFDPVHYKNVFNYINFIDSATYAELFGFSGVQTLPAGFNRSLNLDSSDEAGIFDLATNGDIGKLDLGSLKSEPISGYTMMAVRMKPKAPVAGTIAAIRAHGEFGVKVATWSEASGFFSKISDGLQAFIYFATALIFLVVAFIFMNTLIINVTERTAEIGTMRAMGAQAGFVRNLFLAEALLLDLAASFVAMAAAAVVVLVLGKGGVPLPDTVSQYLIGGGNLPLRLTPMPFVQAFIVVSIVSILATLYPIRVANSITPLKAMADH